MKTKQTILLMLIIIICAIIFCFSNQPADESSNTSGGFIKFLLEINPFTTNLEETQKIELQENLSHIIRKCAHFTEFFILGVLMYWTLEKWFVIHRARLGLILCMLVAAMDETIQLFVEGRSGQVTDMLLDSSGSLVGICMVLVLNKCLARRQRYVY